MSLLLLIMSLGFELVEPPTKPTILIVVGAAGTDEYADLFTQWSQRWEKTAAKIEATCTVIGLEDQTEGSVRDQVKRVLDTEQAVGDSALWVILIGHGTFDGEKAKFNLRGPDLTATDMKQWLERIRRPVVLINGASSSGPFINRLSSPRRIVITATQSGYEQNFARFSEYLSTAICAPEADLDKDDQTSLLEAFLYASKRVEEFYQSRARLATEHALLDDNGDARGTPASWFRGVRVVKKASPGSVPDGVRANQIYLVPSARADALSAPQRLKRDSLELAIEELRQKKSTLSEDDYYQQLETLMIQLARLYEDRTPQ